MAASTITLKELDRLSVDEQGHLYWDGKEVVTTMHLPWIVNLALVTGAAATVIAAAWPIVRFVWWGT